MSELRLIPLPMVCRWPQGGTRDDMRGWSMVLIRCILEIPAVSSATLLLWAGLDD